MDAGTQGSLAFPKDEYERRLARLQERMQELGLDVALVSCRTNQRWLTGFASPLLASRLRSFVSVVGATGGVALIVPPDVYAARTASAAQLRHWDMGETTCTKAAIAAIRECVGSRRARIGIELGWGSRLEMCQTEADDLRSAVDSGETVDIAPVFWQLRAEKSPAEIKKVKQACALTDQAFMEILPDLEPGISELEIETRFHHRMAEVGGEPGFLDVVMGVERHLWANNPSRADRELQRDDLASVDGGCCVDGYHCDINRCFTVSRPSDDVLRVFEALGAANRATTACLAPGKAGADVYATCASEMIRLGLRDILNAQCVVHSVGLDLHEPPECGPHSEGRLSESMTVCVEPWSLHPDLGLFNVEDVVALEGGSARRLTSLPQGIYCVEEQCWMGGG